MFLRLSLALVCAIASFVPEASAADEPPAQREFHLGADGRARIQDALDFAVDWIVTQQGGDGSFQAGDSGQVPPVPLTAMVLWALCDVGEGPQHVEVCTRAAEFLFAFQQKDGGIYDPNRGLAYYTSAVARQGLSRWLAREERPDHEADFKRLEQFIAGQKTLESLDGAGSGAALALDEERVRKLLGRDDISADVNSALEFLKRARGANTKGEAKAPPERPTAARLSYEELLKSVCSQADRESPLVRSAHEAIRASYSMRWNPDLTRRFGPAGFIRRDAGLYYYYLTVARTLGAVGDPDLTTVEGRAHDWSRELSEQLLRQQTKEGYWANKNPRWWEQDPLLVTSYALISLGICRDVQRKPE